jgi:hypothetical protein
LITVFVVGAIGCLDGGVVSAAVSDDDDNSSPADVTLWLSVALASCRRRCFGDNKGARAAKASAPGIHVVVVVVVVAQTTATKRTTSNNNTAIGPSCIRRDGAAYDGGTLMVGQYNLCLSIVWFLFCGIATTYTTVSSWMVPTTKKNTKKKGMRQQRVIRRRRRKIGRIDEEITCRRRRKRILSAGLVVSLTSYS